MASTDASSCFQHSWRLSEEAPSRRPSEGSTTSARSATTQPNSIEPKHQDNYQSLQSIPWITQQQQHHHQMQNAHLRQIAPAPRQNSPEVYVLSNGLPSQVAREFTAENATHNGMEMGLDNQYTFSPHTAHVQHQPQAASTCQPMPGGLVPVNGHQGLGRQPLPSESVPVNIHHGFGAPLMNRNDSPAPDSGLDLGSGTGRQRANTNNDQEMRDLFNRNNHRSLQDVAMELHGNERGPSSERSRQLFAMLWIKSACRKGKTSVPRSRVYASYVKRCAHEKIAVLNPASFGKLVRVLYPGLKTRRLGVRGESKYHYVEFELEDNDEDLDIEEGPNLPGPSGHSLRKSQNLDDPARPSNAKCDKNSDPLPTGKASAADIGDKVPGNSSRREPQFAIYNQPEVASISELGTTRTKTSKILHIEVDKFSPPARLVLPTIDLFLPQGTDQDAAKSLEALYLSHCTSLIECIRFCKEPNFFHLFTAFHGTLTVPVQKLLIHPALEPWIELCDLRMYQNMMQIVSIVALQMIPSHGLKTLRNISDRLVSHIRTSFEGLPEHVLRAKEAPAALFADLLDRTLRVNDTAHATANFLVIDATRTQMYIDFIKHVRTRKIAQSVPAQGMEDVVKFLVTEIRQLLDPKDVPWDLEVCTLVGDHYRQNRGSSEIDKQAMEEEGSPLDRWVALLRSLPTRFSYASSADLVHYIQTISTTIMRDLTTSKAESFQAWWYLKCFVDEMIWFLAERGGFMATQAARSSKRKIHPESEDVETCKTMRLSTGRATDDQMMQLMENQSQVLAPLTPSLQNENQHVVTNHDDSGISLRTSGDDSPRSKLASQVDSQQTEESSQTVITAL